jgi:serine/threonine-protein kinase
VEPEELEGVPRPGEIVVGKYRVERVLGVGGMGCVVAATHTTLAQPVAIKFLLNKAARNPKNIARFTREAQAAASIRSDHVAKVTDIGALDNGTPYMVMEYLAGEDLSQRIERGAMPIDQAVRFLLQACEALAEAHNAGIVHRDLKPANLFLEELPSGEQRVKVLDFGISKIVVGHGEGADLTRTSALMGSPLYMSPEQMMSAKAADGRADIWALGCILFELITMQPPFIGGTLPEICGKILGAPPTPIASLLPDVPPALAILLDKTLAKKPEERFQTLAELALALAPFGGVDAQASSERIVRVLGATTGADSASRIARAAATPLPVSVAISAPGATPLPANASEAAATVASPGAALGASTSAPVAQTWNEEPRRKKTGWIAAGFGAAALVVAGVVFVSFRGERQESAEPSSASAASDASAAGDAPDSPARGETMAAQSATDEADEAPMASSSAMASASAASAPPAPPEPRRPLSGIKQRVKDAIKPVPKPGYQPKPGDDLFN